MYRVLSTDPEGFEFNTQDPHSRRETTTANLLTYIQECTHAKIFLLIMCRYVCLHVYVHMSEYRFLERPEAAEPLELDLQTSGSCPL